MIRIFRHSMPKSLVVLGLGEAAVLFGSVHLGAMVRLSEFEPAEKLIVGGLSSRAGAYAALMMLLLAGMGLYSRQLRDDLRGILFRISLAFIMGLSVIAVVLWKWPALQFGSSAMTVAALVSAAGIAGFRCALYLYREGDLFRRRILILGTGQMARQAEGLRRKSDRRDMELLGYLPVGEASDDHVPTEKRLSPPNRIRDTVRRLRVNEIVVALDAAPSTDLVSELLDCKMSGVRVIEMVTFMEEQTGKIRLDAIDPSRFVFTEGFIQAVVKGYLHRGMDLTLSVVGILLTWPLMLLTAALIAAESRFRAPVLYRQTRVGREGRLYEIIKFRSMRPDAEEAGARFADQNDERVTRVGAVIRKLRIDELPQLFNVLRGEMSFVGPRPERPEFVHELRERIPYYELRLKVNPGITGWAQICYPYGSSLEEAREKLEYDLYYLKNYSLFLDLMILVQTAQVILWSKGAR